MADTIVILQLEHGTITRLLDLIEGHRLHVENGGEIDLPTLALVFDYFREYPDVCHHPKEDLVYRRLQHRDPVAAADLGNLLGDHEELEELTRRVADTVEAARHNGAEATEDLLDGLRRFVEVYREHLAAEDRHFLPTAASRLTREDWDCIDFTLFEREDPIFDTSAENRFLELRRRIFDAVEPAEDSSGSPDQKKANGTSGER